MMNKYNMANCLFETIEYLLKLGEKVIYRPHPIDLTKKGNIKLVDLVKSKFKKNSNFELDLSSSYLRSYSEAKILITDFSGTAYTFSYSTLKPVIFISKNEKNLLKSNNSKLTYFKDRKKIGVMCNLELSEEVKLLNMDSDGIGLFRTEYLYMNRDDLPTEHEQVQAYKKVFKKLDGKPVTLRTLDIGSDKEVSENIKVGQIAKNPALGLRGIRYSLNEKNIFKVQIKAMLRANQDGNLRILIPMITTLDEIVKAKKLIEDAKSELEREKKTYNDKYQIGIMIEVPASAIQANILCKYVDFMSIGTNDLVQYILAIDRIDDEVTSLYDPTNPAVLFLIKQVIEVCNKSKTNITVCGEMAGEKLYTKLLLGLGLTSFSMHPQAIPEIKNIIAQTDVTKIKSKVNAILKCNDFHLRSQLIESL